MNSGASMNMAGSPTQRPGTLRKSSIKGKAPLGRIDQPVNKPVHSNANSQFKRERESRAINKGNPQYIGHSTGSSPNTRTIISESSIHYPIHKLSIDLPEELSTELKTDIYSQIKIRKYSASAIDLTRSYLTVYEYQVDDHWVIWDYETGFVHLTGIWKAALVALNANGRNAFGTSSSNTKADIAKLLESCPRKYHPYIKRKRGGFLKIQGTWMPYNLCRFLAKKFCYYIRYKLIPIFGEDFPSYCLAPTDRGFGQLKLPPGELEDANIELPALPDEVMDETSKAVISKDNGRKRKLPSDAPIRNVRRNKSDTDLLPVRSEITVKQEKDNVFGSSKRPFRPLPQPSKSNNSKNMVAEQELMESPIIISKEGKKDDDKESKDLLLKHISPECNNADLTYSELVDIVNASRCLQLLSKTSPSNDYKAQSSKSDLYNDENDDGKNYTITSQYNKSGISTILFAAGLSREEDSLDNEVLEIEDIRNSLYSDLNLSASPSDNRRSSMKIDDLLS
ncbi:uncharacterized protein RJT21DRAFT_4238 [Scheffersomyces amazonensis]|uniref:uncharacterized protein n=1 Tax=Scheffersomyces amazonensis TaxID=1078765 RepID=UPI00315CE3A8